MGFLFEHSVTIDRPADEVFAFVSDFENNPRWQAGMLSCEWTSEAHAEVGATYVQRARFLGRNIDTHFRVTEFVANQRIAIESTQSTFPIQVTRSVKSESEKRCTVTAKVAGQPKGMLNLFSPMVRKSIRKDYATLKSLLES